MMKPPKPFTPVRFLFNTALLVGGLLVIAPWIMTGIQHYFSWVFQTTGFH